jgi:hypothetical protein
MLVTKAAISSCVAQSTAGGTMCILLLPPAAYTTPSCCLDATPPAVLLVLLLLLLLLRPQLKRIPSHTAGHTGPPTHHATVAEGGNKQLRG